MKELGSIIWGAICGAVLGLGIGALSVGPLATLIPSTIWPYVYGVVVMAGVGLGVAARHGT